MKKPNFGPLNKITQLIESLIYARYRLTSKDPFKFVDLETTLDDYTLISRDESLLTVFEFHGMKSMMDDLDPAGIPNSRRSFFDKIHLLNSSPIIEILRKSGHTIEIFFQFDPDGGQKEIASFVSNQSKTAKRLKVNLQDVTQSQLEHLPKFIHSEHCYLGFWSSPSILDKRELEEIVERRKQQREAEPPYPFRNGNQKGQSPYLGINELYVVHEATIKTLEESFKSCSFSLEKITAKDAIRVVRAALNPLETAQNFEIDKETNELYNWQPLTFGDSVKLTENNTYFGKEIETTLPVVNYKDAIMPSLASQIIINPLTDTQNMRYCQVGNLTFSVVSITMGPQKVTSFNVLFKRLSEAKIPFYFKQAIKSNGIALIGGKPKIANSLLFLSDDNRRIANSYKEVLGVHNSGELTLRMTMQFVTYAPSDDIRLLQSRHSQLVQHLSAWGQCRVSDVTGSPSVALLDSLPFISTKSRSEAMFPNSTDVFAMSPLFRPAPIFRNATTLTRSVDGKVMPIELMSPLQADWGAFFIASPGSGKSVFLNTLLKGAMLKAGANEFPFISVLDIGPSSKALADIIKNALPIEKQHLVQAHKITKHQNYAVNILDLPLMLEEPDDEQLNMIAEIVTEMIGESQDPDFLSLTLQVVERAYREKSNGRVGRPRLYKRNTVKQIDEYIDKYGLPIENTTSWYDVRNMFFSLYVKEMEEKSVQERIPFDYYASIAQRQAVPTLYDLASALDHPSIKDVFNFNAKNSNEIIVNKFRRLLSMAAQKFPNLFATTKLDLTGGRFLSVDLDLVATSDHDTTVMYMVFSYILTKDFRLSKERVVTYPQNCRAYHLERAETLFAQDKFIGFDEFHRPAKTKSKRMLEFTDRFRREGRKWGLSILLSTQEIDDIDPSFIRSFSTQVFMTGTVKFAQQIRDKVGLTEAEYKALIKYCKGTSEKGAPLLAIFATKDEGTASQVLYSTISPIEVWALSTTKEDVLIREKLSTELGTVEARARLGRAYKFTAKPEVSAIMAANNKWNATGENIDPIKFIVNKLLNAPPIYSNNLGAINDAESEVRRYLRDQENLEAEKRQKALDKQYSAQNSQTEEELNKILENVKEEKELRSKQIEASIESFGADDLVEKTEADSTPEQQEATENSPSAHSPKEVTE